MSLNKAQHVLELWEETRENTYKSKHLHSTPINLRSKPGTELGSSCFEASVLTTEPLCCQTSILISSVMQFLKTLKMDWRSVFGCLGGNQEQWRSVAMRSFQCQPQEFFSRSREEWTSSKTIPISNNGRTNLPPHTHTPHIHSWKRNLLSVNLFLKL